MKKERIALQDSKGKLIGSAFLINGKPIPDGSKYCNACSSLKPLSLFSNKGNSCKECANEKSREYYARAREDKEWMQKKRDTINVLGFKRKEEAIEIKGGKCEDCNNSFHQCQYDFHHVDPAEKEFNLANILKRKDFNAVKEELDKCVLLCSNCHRMRHYKERNESIT